MRLDRYNALSVLGFVEQWSSIDPTGFIYDKLQDKTSRTSQEKQIHFFALSNIASNKIILPISAHNS